MGSFRTESTNQWSSRCVSLRFKELFLQWLIQWAKAWTSRSTCSQKLEGGWGGAGCCSDLARLVLPTPTMGVFNLDTEVKALPTHPIKTTLLMSWKNVDFLRTACNCITWGSVGFHIPWRTQKYLYILWGRETAGRNNGGTKGPPLKMHNLTLG
jgi:hypothetical protein